MGDRKDDVRIYLIFSFFFVCSSTGGILLCLYIFLPSANVESWFANLGLGLVAIPWIAWFLIYLYRCFKPIMIYNAGGQFRDRNSHDDNHHHNNKPYSGGFPKYVVAASKAVPRPSVSGHGSVNTHSQNNGGGERHVHFGAVMVVENRSSCGSNNSQRLHKAAVDGREDQFSGELECEEQEDSASESERPLTSDTRLRGTCA